MLLVEDQGSKIPHFFQIYTKDAPLQKVLGLTPLWLQPTLNKTRRLACPRRNHNSVFFLPTVITGTYSCPKMETSSAVTSCQISFFFYSEETTVLVKEVCSCAVFKCTSTAYLAYVKISSKVLSGSLRDFFFTIRFM